MEFIDGAAKTSREHAKIQLILWSGLVLCAFSAIYFSASDGGDNVDMTKFLVVISCLILLCSGMVWVRYGYLLGVLVPRSYSKITTVSDEHSKEIRRYWSSYKRYCDFWEKGGVDKTTSFQWLCVLESLDFSREEIEDFAAFVVELAQLGLSPERFYDLYELGVKSRSDMVVIARNDLDSNLVATIFDLIDPVDRRIRRIRNEPMMEA